MFDLVDIDSGAADGGRLIWRSLGNNEWRARNLDGVLDFFRGEGNSPTLTLGHTYSSIGDLTDPDTLYITGGRVGVGTTSPNQQLEITKNMLLPTASGNTAGNLFFGGDTSLGFDGLRLFSAGNSYLDVKTSSPINGLIFRVDNSAGGTERMRINANGNVGIGTATPRVSLDVIGKINSTEGLIAPNLSSALGLNISTFDGPINIVSSSASYGVGRGNISIKGIINISGGKALIGAGLNSYISAQSGGPIGLSKDGGNLYLAGGNYGSAGYLNGAVVLGSPDNVESEELRFAEIPANGNNYVGFKAPDSMSSDSVYTLPGSSSNGVLTNTGGTLTWAPSSGGSGWTDNGATVTLTTPGDSVGIGATPVNKLDVEGSVAIGAAYSGTNTAPANGLIVEGNVGIGITDLSSVRVNNEEIHTFTPGEARLQVIDTLNSEYSDSLILKKEGPPTHQQGILFVDGNSMQAAIRAKRINGMDTYWSSLLFYTQDGGGDTFQNDITAKMAIDHAGNVGIGTTSPSEKLDVRTSAQFATLEFNSSALIGSNLRFDFGSPSGNTWSRIQAGTQGGSSVGNLLLNRLPAATSASGQLTLPGEASCSKLR